MNEINDNQPTSMSYISTNGHMFILAMRNWLEGTPVSPELYQELISMTLRHLRQALYLIYLP